ncbi:putative metalloprotease CJM1_0395 family protein [Shewanella livingstonensis]|uniref:SrpA-related protein n=1 Tax=Shewanella livingstonensis TaxID=150120 RepID=A0A3G8LU48_9GAMM|nr:putative metalloprotease CJM1_0395 family protein [Shewanella livingstonensis]AZG73099.1 hypothetical protein EGC82_10170 [Shewanella livingstonensis]
MSAAIVSANTGSISNAAQIKSRSSLFATAVQANTRSSAQSSTKASTDVAATQSIDFQSSGATDNRYLKSSSSSFQTTAPSTSAYTAPLDLTSNLASTNTQQSFAFSPSESNRQPQAFVGSDPSSYSLKSGPLNVAGVVNRSQTPLLATGALAETSTSTHASTITSNGDISREQQPVANIFNQPSASPAAATDDTAPVSDGQKATADPQLSNGQDDKAAEQVEQQVAKKQQQIAQAETKQIDQLAQRDTEVKTHEQAHAAVGGSLAQSPSYQYEKGPDGRRYAVEGEVSIDVSTVSGDAQATLTKMQKVYAAAMAPVQPSMADIRVAAQALQNMNEANKELIQHRQQNVSSTQKSQHTSLADNIVNSMDNDQQFTSTMDSNNIITPNSRTLTVEGFSGDEANMNLLSAERGANTVSNANILSDTISNITDSKNTTVAEGNSTRQIETPLSSPERYQQQHQAIEIYV